jgi:hypothetical protein
VLTVSVDNAPIARTGRGLKRYASTSAIVYLPELRSGSATINSTVRYATSQPTEYMKPS